MKAAMGSSLLVLTQTYGRGRLYGVIIRATWLNDSSQSVEHRR
jgi:hypothetical protein